MIDDFSWKAALTICIVVFSILPAQTFAGNRGYVVVFLDTSTEEHAKEIFHSYRATYDIKRISPCWRTRRGEWIYSAYVKHVPSWLSKDRSDEIVKNNKKTIAETASRMSTYRDDLIKTGFDGAFIAAIINSRWEIIGLSRDGRVRRAKIDGPLVPQTLDKALCEAAGAFDPAFSP